MESIIQTDDTTIVIDNEVSSIVVVTPDFGPQGVAGPKGDPGTPYQSQAAQLATETARDRAITAATAAATSATAAATSATSASTAASAANTSAVSAATAATSANTAANNVSLNADRVTEDKNLVRNYYNDTVAAANALNAVFNTFDDRFLGSKATNPTVSNNGAPLIPGATYYNTVQQVVLYYNGVTWESPGLTAQTAANTATDALAQITQLTSTATVASNSLQLQLHKL